MVQFEYVNPLAGLAMLVIGLILMASNYLVYGAAPIIVGVVLIVLYRKYLLKIMGISG